MSFSIQSSSTITGIDWIFGDGNTSNLTNPFHRYAKAGTYQVKAKVTFSGGTTCDTFKTIDVYNPPNVKCFLKSNNSYCLTQNNVCFIDSSNSGNSGVTNTQRTVLWGDGGKTDTQNPPSGSTLCYKYAREGKYTITIEVINQKGCKSKQEFKIEVLYDVIPKFSDYLLSQGCDTQTNVFKLDTSWFISKSEIVSLEYDFKDGTKLKTSIPDSVIHTFRKSGTFEVELSATFKNGCVARYKRNVLVELDRIDITHSKVTYKKCYPGYFEFNHPIVTGTSTRYIWTAHDTSYSPVTAFGFTRNAFFFPDTPGKYYISLEIRRNNCVSVMKYDSVISVGVKVDTKIFNGSQCAPRDTVYFCNKSVIYGSDDVSFLWDFNDTAATRCTTDTKNNKFVNFNCNFSADIDGKHLYTNKKCDEIWMKARDNVNGCVDSAKFNVIIGKPDLSKFKWEPLKMCLGSWPGYGVLFDLESCFGNVTMNLDSACKRDSFIDFAESATYLRTCDPSRWVTLGLAASTGDAKIYRSCDTSDYYIDSSKICNDTIWYHNIYNLDEAPLPQFGYKFTGCIPSVLNGSIFVRDQSNVRRMYFNWDDGQYDTIDVPPGTKELPDFEHTYRRSGIYYPDVVLETDSGCKENQTIRRDIGFYNEFSFDDRICPGMSVFFKDTITYWEDTTQYWRKKSVEKIFWDWDGGVGPATGFEVTARFDDERTYNVRMISINNKGCADTIIKPVLVSDVHAGIVDINKKIICEDIMHLLDSSISMNHVQDSIIYYYWDFGDGKTPSYLKDPFHYYSTYGEFDITHIVKNTIGCTDTATLTIKINGPIPKFEITSDTVGCAPFTATFKNNSEKCTEYIWYFGDATSSQNTLSTKSDTSVSFEYLNPGTYYIYLYGGDSVVNPDNSNKVYFCSSIFPDTNAFVREIRRIIVLPKPKVDFSVEGSLCVNSDLTVTDQSDSIYKYYRWFWLNDSATGPNKKQVITITDSGALTITYKPIYIPQGPYQRACFDTITKTIPLFGDDVEVTFEKEEICPIYHFTADSKNGTKLTWDFGHPSSGKLNTATGSKVSHTFTPEKGKFYVCVTSTTTEGCVDTSCRTVSSEHNFNMFIPNVITPNDDGLNDTYEIDIQGEDYFSLEIYNRWGEKIYSANQDFDENSPLNWNGMVQGTSQKVPPGTYFYIFKFREGCRTDAKIETFNGTITVIY